MSIATSTSQQFDDFVDIAYRISADVGREVEQILQEGREGPLSYEESSFLLGRVISVLRKSLGRCGDESARQTLDGDINKIVERVISVRAQETGAVMDTATNPRRVKLESHKGIPPRPVLPSPWFHGREVGMNSGFVKLHNIQLWESNDRLDIHLSQFREVHGRKPTPEELLDIMLSKMHLPGVTLEDHFEIEDLANSIAVNGVRRPPILDMDGTLLDGNRRVAACYYILNSDKFSSEQKKRVEYVFVWQLTEHAIDDDRNAVVVSLNFEADCKQPWPEYVRAQKVYEEWQTMLALEPRAPGPERLRQMKRDLARKFALGHDASVANRYLKMVDWANEFEEYHINQLGQDTYEVKHRSNEYFQYFDELSKGSTPGGVAHTLNQDEAYKGLVFDLLYQGKFKNYALVRKLKHYDQDVRDALVRAREEVDLDEAQDLVEGALTEASNRKRESRVTGANTRIEAFVKWLEDLPLSSFRKEIRPENLQRLLDALRLVELQAKAVLGE